MSEMALTTAKRAVLEHEAEEGDKRAERAIKLAADSDQLLATIQVAITLVGFASSAVASTSLSDPLATWLMSFGIAPLSAIARGLAPVIITVAVAFVSIVIGELVPKRIGLANAEGVSKQVVGPLSFSKDRSSARVADRRLLRWPGPHPAHQECRRPSERLGRRDQVHGLGAGRPARRGKAHDPRDLRPGRHRCPRGHGAARGHHHVRGRRDGRRRAVHHAPDRLQPHPRLSRGSRQRRRHCAHQGPDPTRARRQG